eukprot:TRINITY_DN20512_c0_g1_i2.p1 TRINITY_DN20512_c0_g1~~TRINITY_DN20512_c0_g1_i2.p1  ORF type:complete len:323 (+),score=22.48 TRINITY_DN20512_c0_g1_i2:145-1113(+)
MATADYDELSADLVHQFGLHMSLDGTTATSPKKHATRTKSKHAQSRARVTRRSRDGGTFGSPGSGASSPKGLFGAPAETGAGLFGPPASLLTPASPPFATTSASLFAYPACTSTEPFTPDSFSYSTHGTTDIVHPIPPPCTNEDLYGDENAYKKSCADRECVPVATPREPPLPSSSTDYFEDVADRTIEYILMCSSASGLVHCSSACKRFLVAAEAAVKESYPEFVGAMFQGKSWRQVLFWHCGPRDTVCATERLAAVMNSNLAMEPTQTPASNENLVQDVISENALDFGQRKSRPHEYERLTSTNIVRQIRRQSATSTARQ